MNKILPIVITIIILLLIAVGISRIGWSSTVVPPLGNGTNSGQNPVNPIDNTNNNVPTNVTVEGKWECLPHRDMNAPHTLECAFGIVEDQTGRHFAISANPVTSMDFSTGTHLRISGLLVPANQLNTNMWQQYPIEGIIEVKKAEVLDGPTSDNNGVSGTVETGSDTPLYSPESQ